MNRKDDHIAYAHAQATQHNDFDAIRFLHNSLPEINKDDVDISTTFLDQTINVPIYINAMTGGSNQAKTINERLAALASHFGIPMALGSFSSAYKNTQLLATYDVINQYDGFMKLANIGADKPLAVAEAAIRNLNADALQIHLNSVQELIMPEGERAFKGWSQNIQSIQDTLSVPVMVKEVGFGISQKTALRLRALGVKHIDVSGRGGTNFATIENMRRHTTYQAFEHWGLSTVESLLQTTSFSGFTVYASGGVRSASDVVKALALGAKAVGLSKFFLTLALEESFEGMVEKTAHLLDEIKTIMCALGTRTVNDLNLNHLIIPDSILL